MHSDSGHINILSYVSFSDESNMNFIVSLCKRANINTEHVCVSDEMIVSWVLEHKAVGLFGL